jgi:hypothetical protein
VLDVAASCALAHKKRPVFDLRFVSRLAAVCRSVLLRKGKKRATSKERFPQTTIESWRRTTRLIWVSVGACRREFLFAAASAHRPWVGLIPTQQKPEDAALAPREVTAAEQPPTPPAYSAIGRKEARTTFLARERQTGQSIHRGARDDQLTYK